MHEVEAGDAGPGILGWLEDAGLVLLLAFGLPVAMLGVGAPVAVFVRLLLEMARLG